VGSSSKITSDHQEIRRWVEERDGQPAHIAGTGDGDIGILRIAFENENGGLEPVSWDNFFHKFDKEGLQFLYQEQTADGKPSRFNKIISKQQL